MASRWVAAGHAVAVNPVVARARHAEPSVEAVRTSAPFVVCVVVTRDRLDLLRRGLTAIAGQTRPPDHIVVVDNGSDTGVADVLTQSGMPHTYLRSATNLGGAGGFAYGILTARALGAHWVWLADDDGRPGSPWTLGRLLVCAADHGLDAVSPLVVDEDDPERLAFPLRRGLRWAQRRSELDGSVLIPNVANLFNGALFSARALDALGLPDPRLFVRGDEVEIHRRLRRSGLRFGTCAPATYHHPSGREDWVPIMGGRLAVLVPRDAAKRELTFRNLGYLTSQPGLRWRRVPDAIRYAWFYLGVQRDPHGMRSWMRATRAGRKELFIRPSDSTSAAGRKRAPSAAPATPVPMASSGRNAG